VGRKGETEAGSSTGGAPAVWTNRDEVLHYTCRVAELLIAGADTAGLPELIAPFPTKGWPLWAAGAFTVYDHVALGDGSWQVSTPFVVGTGAVGVGLAVGSVIAGNVRRNRAQRAAAAAAVPRWVPIGRGTVFLGPHGFYLHTPQVLFWDWPSITSATLTGPGIVHLTGNAEDGPVSWLLQSEYAELLFVIWALGQHPRHPQLAGGWLPPGWLEHARRCGRAPGAAAPAPVVELPPADDAGDVREETGD
jgi:hypothetical protein